MSDAAFIVPAGELELGILTFGLPQSCDPTSPPSRLLIRADFELSIEWS